jgi:hypothetical protein
VHDKRLTMATTSMHISQHAKYIFEGNKGRRGVACLICHMGVTLSREAHRPIAKLDKAIALVHVVYSSGVPLLHNNVTNPQLATMQEGRKAGGGEGEGEWLHHVGEVLEVVKGEHDLVVALFRNSSTVSPATLRVHFL